MATPARSISIQAPDLWEQLEAILAPLESQLRDERSNEVALAAVLRVAVREIGGIAAWLSSGPANVDAPNEPSASWSSEVRGGRRRRCAAGDPPTSEELASFESVASTPLANPTDLLIRLAPRPGVVAESEQGSTATSFDLYWLSVGADSEEETRLAWMVAAGSDARRAALAEVAAVLRQLIAERLIRERCERFERQAADDRSLRELISAVPIPDVREAIRQVTLAVAERSGVDRVWLARSRGTRSPEILGTSDGIIADRRSSRVVSFVERLAAALRLPIDARDSSSESSVDAGLIDGRMTAIRMGEVASSADDRLVWVFESQRRIDRKRLDEIADRLAAFEGLLSLQFEARTGWPTRIGRSVFERLRRPTMWMLVSAGLLVAALVPVPLVIVVDGELQPLGQRRLFAPVDGTVLSIEIEDGATVSSGQTLLTLRDDLLAERLARLEGGIRTADAERAGLEARLSSLSVLDAEQFAEVDRIRVRQSILETQRRGLADELAQARTQERALTIVAPIDGRIMAPDLRTRLESRPLERGEPLMTVADLQGPWEVHASIPPDDLGPIRSRLDHAADSSALRIDVLSAIDGASRFQAVRPRLGGRMLDEGAGIGLPLRAELTSVSSEAFRPGTRVTLRIDCGRSPLAKVLFRRLLDQARRYGWW
jgi:multidrug efflux pump subunit AcrA (membrane-fusion protein)